MRYEIIGANRADGSDVMRVYDAADEDEAVRRANADGVVVQRVDLLIDFGQAADTAAPSLADAVKLHSRAAAERAAAARATATKAKAAAKPAAAAVDYRGTADGDATSTPSYAGLRVAEKVLLVAAALSYVAALVVFVATIGGLRALSNATSGFNAPPRTVGAGELSANVLLWATIFAPTFALLVVGAFTHGASAACAALRDVARNSWHSRASG